MNSNFNKLILCILLCNPLITIASGIVKDTLYNVQCPKFPNYQFHTNQLNFDSGRVSHNGNYALIYQGKLGYTGFFHYWTLFHSGYNNILEDKILIYSDTVFILSYNKSKKSDSIVVNYYENGINKEIFYINQRIALIDFLSNYSLLDPAINKLSELSFKIDSLSPVSVALPMESSVETIGKRDYILSHQMEINFVFNDNTILKDTVSYLINPKGNEESFNSYLEKIRNLVTSKSQENHNFNFKFYVFNSHFFLEFNIPSLNFDGITFLEVKERNRKIGSIAFSQRPDEKASFILLK